MSLEEKNLILWKHIWDLLISAEDFREETLAGPTYLIGDKIAKNRGSLYMPPEKKEDEGHFVGYEKNKTHITIFDPSGFAYQQFNDKVAEKVSQLSNKKLKLLEHHPQEICQGDTFCQTWSYAWLKPSLHKKVLSANTEEKAVDTIYSTVESVIKNAKFTSFLRHHRTIFNKWISEARKDNDYFEMNMSRTTIKDVEDFIHYSRQITRDDIEYIMLM